MREGLQGERIGRWQGTERLGFHLPETVYLVSLEALHWDTHALVLESASDDAVGVLGECGHELRHADGRAAAVLYLLLLSPQVTVHVVLAGKGGSGGGNGG